VQAGAGMARHQGRDEEPYCYSPSQAGINWDLYPLEIPTFVGDEKRAAEKMSTSSQYPVYTGIWTNWSYGKVMGATLTLTRSNANLLIAFVALFLSVITTRLWAIISFSIHTYLATPDARDTLHHQRQAVLRNNGGPSGTTWTLIQLAWRWRQTPGKSLHIPRGIALLSRLAGVPRD
jgi:hypothetical protein